MTPDFFLQERNPKIFCLFKFFMAAEERRYLFIPFTPSRIPLIFLYLLDQKRDCVNARRLWFFVYVFQKKKICGKFEKNN
jgi:hypothetical protein